VEAHDTDSLLNYYTTLLRLRKENAALRDGDFTLVNENDNNVLSWLRKSNDGKSVVVALNFTASPQTVTLDQTKQATTVLSSFSKVGDSTNLSHVTLPPYGAYIGQVQQ
jgi:alpha-glucosidase